MKSEAQNYSAEEGKEHDKTFKIIGEKKKRCGF